MIISNKKINNIYFAIFVVLFSFTLISFSLPNNTKAVSASNWNPGRIIDDAVFFNSNSMSPGQIQNFLNAKVPVCDTNNPFKGWIGGVYNSAPYTCLKDYNEGGKGSAQIIWEAGQTHGINPQVLIIMLQKESALVTDTWAAPWQYKSAMGYGCPDTAECDSKYYGFSNQVNNAAWQLRAYVNNPNGYNFRSGVTRNIQWSPNGACGSSPVFIQNSATAALYNYTPYQPNQAALNNLYGIGDGCSAYGNRNFWRMFNDWFGSTSGQGYEFVDAINPPNQVLPNDVVGATIRIRNRSGVTWYSDGNVPAGQHAMRLASLSYLNTPYANTADPAWLGTQNQIRMKEQTVADGGIATFEFTFRSPMHQVTTYWTQFAPVFDGSYFMPYIGLSFITSTPTPNYSYRLETATGIPTSISANSAQPASYLLRNTGNVVWWGETNRMIGAAPTRLFTINPYYHPSAFYDPGTWLANNQVKLQADRIDPGAAGLFSFILKSPSESNTYSESFGLILDGRTPYPTDNQMSFNTYVGDYSYSLVNSNLPSSLIPGQKYDCVITIKNTGAATWYSDGNTPSGSSPVRLITAGYSPHPLHNQSDSGWLTSSQIRMYNSSVAPIKMRSFALVLLHHTTLGMFYLTCVLQLMERLYFQVIFERIPPSLY